MSDIEDNAENKQRPDNEIINGTQWFYKPHKGGLAESMAELGMYCTIDAMFEAIVKDWSAFKKLDKSRMFLCAEERYDGRIGAYLHYVGYLFEDEDSRIPHCLGHAFCKFNRAIFADAFHGKYNLNWNPLEEKMKREGMGNGGTADGAEQQTK